MTEKKTSFVLPTDLLSELEDFSDDEVGKIFRAVLNYTSESAEPCFGDRAMKVVFRHIRKYIDSANENYDKKVQANRINGAKGGRPKKEAAENPTVFEETQRFSEKPDKTYTESETDSKSEIESESESEFESVSKARTRTKKYGEHNNVELSDDEYGRLAERMGVSNRNSYIEKLSDYMAATGKRYQSHYATIRNWFRQDGGTKPSYDMDEIMRRAEQLPVYKSNKKKKNENENA